MANGDFVTDEIVDMQHGRAIQMAASANFDAAEWEFNEALELVDGAEAYQGDRLSAELHRARILRDLGFVAVRRTPSETDRRLEEGYQTLEASLQITDVLLTSVNTMSVWAEAYLMGEHGATKTFLGRYFTYRYTRGGNLDDLLNARDIFAEATLTLREGDNTYYRTSNAVHAARAARLHGDRRGQGEAMRQAASSTLEAIRFDRRNATPALKTFVLHQALMLAPDGLFRRKVRENP